MSSQQSAVSNQQVLRQKRERVEILLAGFQRVIVAFSGGVDSTLLAKLARDVLGKRNAVAVTADSPSLSRRDFCDAQHLTAALDLEHLIIATHEMANPAYRANAGTRCYFCKQELFVELDALARARGIPVILYGAIGDDHAAERPGQRAAAERGVRAPLQEVGLAKWEVRELARLLGLPNWDRPQNACLSSRIPHGSDVTEEKLRQVERAEAALLQLGFHHVRVRHQGTHARIEVNREDVPRFGNHTVCQQVLQQFAQLGFQSIGIDRAGYRPGGADHQQADEIHFEVHSS